MEFLKRLKQSLFDSFRSSNKKKEKTQRAKQPKTIREKDRAKFLVRASDPGRPRRRRSQRQRRRKRHAAAVPSRTTGSSRSLSSAAGRGKRKSWRRPGARFRSASRQKRGSVRQAREPVPQPPPLRIGMITHYFGNVKAGVVKISGGALRIGDRIHIKGSTTDFTQTVTSLQINRQDIPEARSGQEVGILVKERVRPGDEVFKL